MGNTVREGAALFERIRRRDRSFYYKTAGKPVGHFLAQTVFYSFAAGGIPKQLGNITGLRTLEIHRNLLSGELLRPGVPFHLPRTLEQVSPMHIVGARVHKPASFFKPGETDRSSTLPTSKPVLVSSENAPSLRRTPSGAKREVCDDGLPLLEHKGLGSDLCTQTPNHLFSSPTTCVMGCHFQGMSPRS